MMMLILGPFCGENVGYLAPDDPLRSTARLTAKLMKARGPSSLPARWASTSPAQGTPATAPPGLWSARSRSRSSSRPSWSCGTPGPAINLPAPG